jgi:hypothetical protein
MTHLERLGNMIKIPIQTDEQGYLGRECPISECEGYFKIIPGTGLQGVTDCYCPYCGHKGSQNEFFTKDQIEHAKSIAIRQVTDALVKDLKTLDLKANLKDRLALG